MLRESTEDFHPSLLRNQDVKIIKSHNIIGCNQKNYQRRNKYFDIDFH